MLPLRKLNLLLSLALLPLLSLGQWTTSGNASNTTGDCFRLTPDISGREGGIQNTQAYNLADTFYIKASANFGNKDATGGLGIKFYMSATGNMGTYGLYNADSLAVLEFDCHQSGPENDPASDHISLFKTGNFDHSSANSVSTTILHPNWEDGAYHNIDIWWMPHPTDNDSSILQVRFDCDSVYNFMYNYVDSALFGATTAFIGFWANTGGSFNQQTLCIEYESGRDYLSDTLICRNDTISLSSSQGQSYSWLPIAGIIGTTVQSPQFSPDTTTRYSVTITDSCGTTRIDTVRITVDSVTATLAFNNVNICAFDTTSLPLTVTGGYSTSYTYIWNDGWRDSTHFVLPDTNTTYVVTVEDVEGCRDTASVAFTVDTLPAINLGLDSAVCQGDSIILRMTTDPSYTYQWLPGGSTADTFVVDSTVQVFGIVTNSLGCKGRDTVSFFYVADPIVSLGNDTAICDGEIVNLDAGNVGLEFDWLPNNDTTQTIVVDTAGTYSVTVTNSNMCQGFDTITIFVDTLPVVDLGPDTALCVGDTLSLDAGPHYKAYIWNTGSGNRTHVFTATSAISVLVVDSNDCQGSDNLSLVVDTNPTIDLGNDTTICDQDSITLNTYSGLFSQIWNADTNLKSMSLVIDTANSYTVVITDSNGCQGFDTLDLTIDTLPVVFLGNDTSICDGFATTLDAGTGYMQYTWINNGSTTNTLTVDTTNNYWVHVIDSNECTTSDTISVLFDTLPEVDLGVDTSICFGDNITFDAGPNYSNYAWNVGPLVQTITVDSAFQYVVGVIDMNGCVDSDTINLTIDPLPVVNLGPDRQLCIGVPISETLDAGPGFVNYAWDNGLGSGDESSHRTVIALTQGTFTVTVTDFNGCENSDDLDVTAVYQPTVNLGPDTFYCIDEQISFVMNTGSGFSKHIWTNRDLPAGADTIATSGQILLVDTAGRYRVDIVEIFNGRECINFDTLTVHAMPVPLINIAGSHDVCETDVIQFTISAAVDNEYRYKWNTGESTSQITVSSAGAYTVTVTMDSSQCDAEETYTIVEHKLPNVNFVNDTLVCENKTLKLDAANSGYVYEWKNMASYADTTIIVGSDSVFVTDTAGEYRVRLNNNICYYEETAFVEYDVFPSVFLGDNTTLCAGDTLWLNASFAESEVEFLWQDGSTDSLFPARFTDEYQVEVSNGCGVDVNSIYVVFEDCSQIWVPNAFTPNDDNDNEFFRAYSLEDFLEFNIRVFDAWGNVVYESSDMERVWDGNSFDGTPLPVGTYVWEITYQSRYEVAGPEGAPTRNLHGMVNLIR